MNFEDFINLLTKEDVEKINQAFREHQKPVYNFEPQLLAELISAVKLNQFKEMKGAFIIGENWVFVILNRLAKHKYQYSLSRTFNSSNINDLQSIYKNLLFVKHEILEIQKRNKP